MKKIKIQNSKGRHIAANLYSPTEQTNKLAILCPGYLHTKDYLHLVTLAEGLVERGYTVVTFDPLGTWESEGDISDYKVSQYIKDVKTVLDYMEKEEIYTHILLGGHSRGGGISLLVAAEDPRISIVLGIMVSPQKPLTKERFSSWEEKGFESSLQIIPNTNQKKEFKIPFSYVEDRSKYSITEAAKNITVPTYLFWGGMDNEVNFHDSNEIYKVISAPKKIIQIPFISHNYWDNPEDLKNATEVILRNIK